MEVAMESAPPVSSSLSQSFPPPSPTASRKRSFDQVEGFERETKRAQTSSESNDQENRAPEEQKASSAIEKVSDEHDEVMKDRPTEAQGGPVERGRTPAKETTPVNSVLATISAPNSTTPTGASDQQPLGTATASAQKKRKLSPASKEAKRIEKEAKEKQKLEEKAKKEEEKAKREEEKRQKEEERKKRDAEREEERKKKEEKKKLKEEERLAKEEERKKKEDEKIKKERSQMRLNAFFAKPRATPSSAQAPSTNQASPNKVAAAAAADGSNTEAPDTEPTDTISDYKREFPDFFVQSHTQVAPINRFERDAEALRHLREKLDEAFKSGSDSQPEPSVSKLAEVFNAIPYRRRRGRHIVPVKDILLKLQESQDLLDPTKPGPKPQDMLRKVTMKTLKFSEDVRPPYQGTYTRRISEECAMKLSRNPFQRQLPETNYDYDSEAEWEEPEEGEDLDSEGEEELSEDGEDDMDGFLDDDDENQIDGKRRLIVGDLEPVCSGLRWQETGVDPELDCYKVEIISEAARFPIDPFSTAYWEKPKASENVNAKSSMPAPAIPPGRSTLHAFMGPPGQGVSAIGTDGQTGSALPSHPASKTKKLFPPEQLAEFKEVVEGSDLTKMGLIEILKKRFPKVSKDVLKDTLNSVATRVGQKEADKKWVCK
ncbi:conserved hypothetical protein [Paecilomyces variotii No. 5]|uniref:Chromatin assembly factor 1 subunit A n=1 Tax=Byssochlamys spectabilis (strain No. 5 / NBRC 109023) TaxID=1356009 RepID=V5I239_BYSSN|nr:conserved hypothetical protein [Paecilomyces variotii No. 5]